jgi:nucleotide-binding universal stress UspA family protein
MIKSILLATDGSEHAWTAWRYALDIARAYRARLLALSVVDLRSLQEQPLVVHTGGYAEVASVTSLELTAKMEDEQTELLEEVRRKTQAADVPVEVLLERGAPTDSILSHASLVDLIALGHYGHRSRWDTLFLGSVAEAIVQQSPKPVLVASEQHAPIERVLAAYDGSESAQRALHWAADLTTTLKLPLNVVHVSSDPVSGEVVLGEATAYLKPYNAIPQVETFLRDAGKASIAEQILSVAAERGVGLVVMGAHGHSRLYKMLLDSETSEVLRQSDKPLLMTR